MGNKVTSVSVDGSVNLGNFLRWMDENIGTQGCNRDWNWSVMNFPVKYDGPSVDINDSDKAVLVALRWGAK